MSKNTKRSNATLKLRNPMVLVAVIFAVAGGIYGTYKLTSSFAATPSPDFVTITGPDRPKANNPALTTTTDYVNYRENQTVLVVKPGQSASFWRYPGYPTTPNATRNCYIMRAVGSGVRATITGWANSKEIVVPVSNSGTYQSYCVSVTYKEGPNPAYDVKNNSGGNLRIYQSMYFFTVPDPKDY